MSQQEGRSHEDDWWHELYDGKEADTGPAGAADSLDDRFDSASRAVGARGGSAPDPSQCAAEEGEWWQGSPSLPEASPTGPAPEEWPEPTWPPRVGEAASDVQDEPRDSGRRSSPPPPRSAPDDLERDPGDHSEWWLSEWWLEPPPNGGSEPPGHGPQGADAADEADDAVPPVPHPRADGAEDAVPSVPRPRTEQPSDAPSGHRPYPLPSPTPGPPPAAAGSDPQAREMRPPAEAEYIGDRPPTYEGEPTVLPAADPDDLDDFVPDTVLDGARHGSFVLRAASLRGDSARYRGTPRRDALLTARFGSGECALLLVAVATGTRAAEGAHRAAADACRWIGQSVGRNHARLAEDIRADKRDQLKSGLHRLTDHSYGRLRNRAAGLGLDPEQYTATLRCLLLPADPACRTRVFFGLGDGGFFRLRGGAWQDIESTAEDAVGAADAGQELKPPDSEEPAEDSAAAAEPAPDTPSADPSSLRFRFHACTARPGDTLLLCSPGLAEPLRCEPALAELLAERWTPAAPPGLAAFLADVQVRAKGYADDRTAAAVWEV